jgi:hypothetical protein
MGKLKYPALCTGVWFTLLAGGLLAVLGHAERQGVGGDECLLSRKCPCSLCPLLSRMILGMARVNGGEALGVITCCGM